MRELCDVYGTRTSSTEEGFPVVLDFSIEASVLDVVRQQILNFERSVKSKGDSWIGSARVQN